MSRMKELKGLVSEMFSEDALPVAVAMGGPEAGALAAIMSCESVQKRIVGVLLESDLEENDARVLRQAMPSLLRFLTVMTDPAVQDRYNTLVKEPIERLFIQEE